MNSELGDMYEMLLKSFQESMQNGSWTAELMSDDDYLRKMKTFPPLQACRPNLIEMKKVSSNAA